MQPSRSTIAPLVLATLVIGIATSVALAARPAPGDLRFQRGEDMAGLEAFPPSVFQHWRHRIHFRCDACHDRLFKMEAGANTVTMELIKAGEACGACHNGKVAFPASFQNCSRCHAADED